MMYPHTITVINRKKVGRETLYYPTTLKGVHFQDKQGVKTGNTTHVTDNNGYVQIPHILDGYLEPHKWEELTVPDGYWTLKENDFIVKGDTINLEAPQDTVGARTIDSIENIDYSIFISKHFGVTLK